MIRLTNEQWERIRNHFPEEHIPDGRPGRKPIPTRRVFEAVLWILNTGAQWHMLPPPTTSSASYSSLASLSSSGDFEIGYNHASQRTNTQYQTDLTFGPTQISKIKGDEDTECGLHIGQEEIHPVETLPALRRD
jgi:Putative transposase of IS4/5 family (DUF4096)